MELKFMKQDVMRPELMTCPHCGEKNRIGVHSRKERRYKCYTCGKTFSENVGSLFYGLHYPVWVVVLVLTLLAFGCPPQAIVSAFMIDERTVREWLARAGSLGKFIQKKYVCNGKLELGQVQADELCINTQKGKVWMATAMSVFSRLFIWGVVSVNRSQAMIEKLMKKVKSSAKSINDTILFSVDGFKTYPKVILKTFRIKVYSGKRGRPRYKVWENIHIAQVIKSHKGQKLTNICRKVFYGSVSAVYQIIAMSQVVFGLINTSFIERLNATFRSRMPSLVRKTRNLALLPERLESEMFWSGVVYNFCTVHSSLGTAPAVAAGLTSEVCSIEQLLRYKIPK